MVSADVVAEVDEPVDRGGAGAGEDGGEASCVSFLDGG